MQHWKKILGGALTCFLGATLQLPAQQGGGGGGGFGGFGGFGGGGGNNNANRNNNSSSQYNPNGAVGTATITVDQDTRNIVFSTDDQTAEQIRQVLRNLDRPKPQVLIKVVFLQVQHNKGSDIGIEGTFGNYLGNSLTSSVANVFGANGLNSITTNFNVSGPAQAIPGLTPFGTQPVGIGSGMYQILGTDFTATLRAIAQAGKSEVLSRPSILARDGQPATITVGQSVPLISSVTYAGVASIPVNNVTYTDVGIILKVTPYISPEGYVEMIVSPQNSAINPDKSQWPTISQGVQAPVIDISSADTVVITPDSQTVVIGGLMGSGKSSSESKVPFLGDIPWLGNLFKRRQTADSKNELLIFLTPHIIQAPGQLAALTVREQNHMLTPKSYSEAELNRFLEKVPVKKQ